VSTPPFLDPPEGTRRERLAGAHGELAALVLDPPPGTQRGAPALLVPGFTGSKEDFIAVLAPIAAAGHPVVAVDLRGQFESVVAGAVDEDPGTYDVAALAADVVAIGTALAASSGTRVHLVGHSFGGVVSRAAVAADPAPWASLTLMASGPGPIPGTSADNLGLIAQVLPAMDLATVWEAKGRLEEQAGVAKADAATEDFLRRRFLANSPLALKRLAEQLLVAPEGTYGIDSLGIPVLVLYGDLDDAWTPESQAMNAKQLGADHVVIEGAGHSPAADDPETTARALTDFWAARG
jgi:pimeloyl-ACP methyl ester carboxylesterase